MLTINGSDISRAVTEVSISEEANAGAASLSFLMTASEASKIKSGDKAVFAKDGKALFCGQVYSRSVSSDMAEMRALDGLCALNTVMPVQRETEAADGFVKKVLALCAPYVSAGAVDPCAEVLPPMQFERTPLTEIIYRTIDEIKAGSGRYLLRDEAGSVAFRNERSLQCSTVLDGRNIVAVRHQSSVGDAYSYVKLTSNSVENALSAVAIAKNEAAMEKWGPRSYVAEVREKNPEQLILSAKAILNDSCREKETLSVMAVGNAEARAGCLIRTEIDGVGTFWARILASEHRFEGKGHFMTLSLERMQ